MTARIFVPYEIGHPLVMLAFLVLTSVTFSLFGFIIGIWADGFEKLQMIPMLVVTPLTFLSGTFYSVDRLPPAFWWLAHFNPFFYMIDGFRYGMLGTAQTSPWLSGAVLVLVIAGLYALTAALYRRGWHLKG